jgi:hypothetical protein
MSINMGQFKKGQIPWNKVEWINKFCLQCGIMFSVKPFRKDTAKYCSIRCSVKATKNHKDHFHSNTPIAGRKRAMRRFPCPKGFDRHHVDGNPLNNNPNNIQILVHEKHASVSIKSRDRDDRGRLI